MQEKKPDRWDSYPEWKQWALILTSWPFVIAARVIWQYNPSIAWCLLFWFVVMADEPLRWGEMRGRRRTLYGIATLGALGNAVATIANGGHMPVGGDAAKLVKPDSLWIVMTDASRVQWLCDIYGGASLGDFFIGTALLGLLLNWAAEKFGWFIAEPKVEGKRAPGFGIG